MSIKLQLYSLKGLALLPYICLLLLASCGGSGNNNTGDSAIAPTIDLPFSYSIGTHTLELPVAGGTIYANIGAFGGHFHPHSGDFLGDTKSNLTGLFARSYRELEELAGNGNGQCDIGESCGYWGGLTGDIITQQTPTYTAPSDAVLRRLTFHEASIPAYFGTPPHWEIELSMGSRFTLRIGHLASIAPSLRDKILDATGIDTDGYTSPLGNLFTNGSIRINIGEALGQPHVFATEIAGFPGYYSGGGGIASVPLAQMEFPFIDHNENAEVCLFNFLDTTRRAAIQTAMDNDMEDPDSARYGPNVDLKWLWGAEGVLCPAHSSLPEGFGSIHTRLGGWTERPTATTTVDEWFAIVPIAKTAAIYDMSNYDSAAVNHVVARHPGPGLPPLSLTMPDLTEITAFLVAGEVLEETSDSLLIKWRNIWTSDVYQRATFLLDSEGLKIKWGDFATTRDSATQPTLATDEACNDSEVICYDHEARL